MAGPLRIVNVTGNPLLAVADKANAGSPTRLSDSERKSIVCWSLAVAVIVRSTETAL